MFITSLSRRFNPLAVGFGLSALLALAATGLAAWPPAKALGLSSLTLAIVLGIVAGNTIFPSVAERAGPGVDFARGPLLRAGIVLFGLRISFQDLGAVGLPGLVIGVAMVVLVFGAAMWLGTRWLGLDRQTAALIGAGSAICGAAAIMAAQPVVRGEEHKVSIAVATVVVFGTLSMILYPLVWPYLGMSEHSFGLFAGSTIHEVAQVVAVGDAIGPVAAKAAVVEKMLRVMLLAPFLLCLSLMPPALASDTAGSSAAVRRSVGECCRHVRIPWFAVLFIALIAVHSLMPLPAGLIAALVQIDTLLLATAMAAMGLRTSVASLRRAGAQPLKLAGALFLCLTLGGYAVNVAVMAMR